MVEFVGIRGLAKLQANIGRVGATSRKAARLAINDSARWGRSQGSKEIRRQVNLKASYVNKHLEVSKKASDKSLAAVISATKRPVLLNRYGAKQLTRKAKGSARSKGDPLRGIPAGRKSAGISVKVKARGSRKKMRGAFFVPLKGSGVMGLATRTGPKRDDYEVHYGPSVDQVWRSVRDDISPEVEARLAREFQRQLKRLL